MAENERRSPEEIAAEEEHHAMYIPEEVVNFLRNVAKDPKMKDLSEDDIRKIERDAQNLWDDLEKAGKIKKA